MNSFYFCPLLNEFSFYFFLKCENLKSKSIIIEKREKKLKEILQVRFVFTIQLLGL